MNETESLVSGHGDNQQSMSPSPNSNGLQTFQRRNISTILNKTSDILSSGSRGISLHKRRQHDQIVNSYAYSQVKAAKSFSTTKADTSEGIHVQEQEHSDNEQDNIQEATVDGAKRFQIRHLQDVERKQKVSSSKLL